eukprot:Pgem_evm1s17235
MQYAHKMSCDIKKETWAAKRRILLTEFGGFLGDKSKNGKGFWVETIEEIYNPK